MTEKIEEMLKKLHDALENDGSIEEVKDLCNQILILDPENPNAKIMKAAISLLIYYESKDEESGLEDFDDDSLDVAEKVATEVLELLTGITRIDEITEASKSNFSSIYGDFLDEWGRQRIKHGHHSRNRNTESLLVSIINLFPSRVEKQQNQKMKFFLDKLVQLPWLQTYSGFLEEYAYLFKSRTIGYKILKDATKLLINVNKDVDKKTELGIAAKNLKKIVIRKNIFKGIKWFFIVQIIIVVLHQCQII